VKVKEKEFNVGVKENRPHVDELIAAPLNVV
jgi:hypothetical protein